MTITNVSDGSVPDGAIHELWHRLKDRGEVVGASSAALDRLAERLEGTEFDLFLRMHALPIDEPGHEWSAFLLPQERQALAVTVELAHWDVQALGMQRAEQLAARPKGSPATRAAAVARRKFSNWLLYRRGEGRAELDRLGKSVPRPTPDELVALDARQAEMETAAVAWQYLTVKAGRMARKSDLDTWLMERYGIERHEAHRISNTVESRRHFTTGPEGVHWIGAGPEPQSLESFGRDAYPYWPRYAVRFSRPGFVERFMRGRAGGDASERAELMRQAKGLHLAAVSTCRDWDVAPSAEAVAAYPELSERAQQIVGAPIPGTTLYRVRAGDVALHGWFGLYSEEPVEDGNDLEGCVVEKADGRVRVLRAGQFETYTDDQELAVTWAEGLWPPAPPRDYQVAITSDHTEAGRIIAYFQKQGIPMAAATSAAFGYSLNTDQAHFERALALYDSASGLVNVVSGETTRVAAWNQVETVLRGGLGYDHSRRVFDAIAARVASLGFRVWPRSRMWWHSNATDDERVLFRDNDTGGVTEILWLSQHGEICSGAMLADQKMLKRHFAQYKRTFQDPAIKQALDALRAYVIDLALDPVLDTDEAPGI